MKRTFLDITDKISRRVNKVVLRPVDLNNSLYSIWVANGWKFYETLDEIEYIDNSKRLRLTINTQAIGSSDYLVEMSSDGILIKFIKSKFQYELDSGDYIEIIGNIESYA